ncbi:MAG: hypothetical protein PF690_04740 [Deltaproteobacteria bacterium]|jgi:hypothetical protein|nr:hypothetical protein [Deltaproteobacteria bacterium]
MTPEQNKLIDKSLGVIGFISLAGAAALSLWGIVVAIFDRRVDFPEVIEALLGGGEFSIIFYPLICIGIICLWIRSFLKAGRK